MRNTDRRVWETPPSPWRILNQSATILSTWQKESPTQQAAKQRKDIIRLICSIWEQIIPKFNQKLFTQPLTLAPSLHSPSSLIFKRHGSTTRTSKQLNIGQEINYLEPTEKTTRKKKQANESKSSHTPSIDPAHARPAIQARTRIRVKADKKWLFGISFFKIDHPRHTAKNTHL